MLPRALSLALAASTLTGALWLGTRDLWLYGPMMVYPFFGAPVVAVLMAVRAALVRRLGGPPDPVANSLGIVALGSMLAPSIGMWSWGLWLGQPAART